MKTHAYFLKPNASLSIELPLDVVDVPGLSIHRGHGQRESDYDSTPAMRRLIWRKIRSNPLRLLKLAWKTSRLKRHAKKHRDKKT
jgi:hypothetical protein